MPSRRSSHHYYSTEQHSRPQLVQLTVWRPLFTRWRNWVGSDIRHPWQRSRSTLATARPPFGFAESFVAPAERSGSNLAEPADSRCCLVGALFCSEFRNALIELDIWLQRAQRARDLPTSLGFGEFDVKLGATGLPTLRAEWTSSSDTASFCSQKVADIGCLVLKRLQISGIYHRTIVQPGFQ